MKKAIIYAVISALLYFAGYQSLQKLHQSEYQECGKVVDMANGFETVRHHTKNHTSYSLENRLIIVVNFAGDYRSVDVSENIFYRKKIGDSICFDRHSDDWEFATMISFLFFAVCGIISIVKTFKYINQRLVDIAHEKRMKDIHNYNERNGWS